MTVRDCSFKYCNSTAIALYNCIDVRISNCHFEDALDDGNGYGISLNSACQNVTISNITSRNLRHTITGGTSSGWYGGPTGVTITNITATESRDSAIDCHPGFNAWDISNCTIIGRAGATNFKGIGMRGGNGNISNCIIRNLGIGSAGVTGIEISHTAYTKCSWNIVGNSLSSFYKSADYTYGILVNLTSSNYTDAGKIVIADNKIDGVSTAIQILGISGVTISDLDIANNNISNADLYGITVYTGDFDGVRIRGNNISGLSPSASGDMGIFVEAYTGTMNDVSVIGNNLKNWDTGIYIYGVSNNITNVICSNNKSYNCAYMGRMFRKIDKLTVDHDEQDTSVAYGCYFWDCTLWRVDSCIFKTCENSIFCNGTNTTARITNNDFYNCSSYGMYNNSTLTGTYLKNNRFFGTLPSALIDSSMSPIPALANSATPSVKGNDTWLTGGTTTITNITEGYIGQIITILAEHSITITDGTNIFLNGSANFVMKSTDSLMLVNKADGKWYEISRGVN